VLFILGQILNLRKLFILEWMEYIAKLGERKWPKKRKVCPYTAPFVDNYYNLIKVLNFVDQSILNPAAHEREVSSKESAREARKCMLCSTKYHDFRIADYGRPNCFCI
jgi:hypothetical protein